MICKYLAKIHCLVLQCKMRLFDVVYITFTSRRRDAPEYLITHLLKGGILLQSTNVSFGNVEIRPAIERLDDGVHNDIRGSACREVNTARITSYVESYWP